MRAASAAEQDADERLTYVADFSARLADSVAIGTAPSVTVEPPGLIIDHVTIMDGAKRVQWQLSGGVVGTKYHVTCRIVSGESPQQTHERHCSVRVTT